MAPDDMHDEDARRQCMRGRYCTPPGRIIDQELYSCEAIAERADAGYLDHDLLAVLHVGRTE